ncbi:MAG: NAD(P)/FAD-dependent oxidoreductase [Methanosarcinales archaeon]|nr:MAG: NAD(P)/FAD-dependent oxidoreductase [Methanosarcinales archaeon]
MKYDVVVVGAGPAGAIAARCSAKHDANTLIIEEHPYIGSPVQCTGIISIKALDECDLKPESSFVYRNIRGANIYSPGNHCIKIDGGKTKAHVIDRKIFDRILVAKALDEGADLILRTKATALKNNKNGAVLTVRQNGTLQEIQTKVVIGADGIQSSVARMSGLGRVGKILSCIQVEGQYEMADADFVEIFLGNNVAPGFFAWVVPAADSIARIGLCVNSSNSANRSAHQYLKKLLKEHSIVSTRYHGSSTSMVVGGMPVGALKHTCTDAVIIVGDAAGQIKPTSGGGIYTCAVCAKIAGGVASIGDASKKGLELYDTMWRKCIGKELTIGMHIHNTIGNFSDQRLDEFINIFDDQNIMDAVRQYGDMDQPSVLLGKIAPYLNKKQLFTFAGSIIKDFINSK